MGLIFTRGDLKEVSEEVAKYKVCSLVLYLIIVPFNIFVKKNQNHQGKKYQYGGQYKSGSIHGV